MSLQVLEALGAVCQAAAPSLLSSPGQQVILQAVMGAVARKKMGFRWAEGGGAYWPLCSLAFCIVCFAAAAVVGLM